MNIRVVYLGNVSLDLVNKIINNLLYYLLHYVYGVRGQLLSVMSSLSVPFPSVNSRLSASIV